ncbi:hypothetical protein SAMN05660462_01321 [Proteiniborus ethanoligenes]|uniref:Uncharacterized protein n=1 Tax=Proteiniborus ethanoligenes TaxID=415015 RepID=A0A1H3P0W1_9FIRM|nr:hypothetical protein [Proteiniborus ethanoligenes]SDY94691.1 hypothetical protein SAMN05660462_01321 [Proteiniborus ethanoligenes]
MKKHFVVVGKKKKSVYMWDYVENEYYEFTSTNKSGLNFHLYNVIEVDSDKFEVLRNSSVIKFDLKDAKAIGKTDLKLFLEKMKIISGWQFATFEDLFNQRKEKWRIISLVKFSGSTITNGQLRIKHKEDYSYCDILDNELKKEEGFEYNGIALMEYIPDKRKERSFNLIFSVENSFKKQKKKKAKYILLKI